MKQGWQLKRLGEVLKLEYGKPLSADKRSVNGEYPVYGANGEIARSNEYYFDKQSIIVGRKGTAGAINITKDKFYPLDVTYYVVYDDKEYSLKYLFYILSHLNLPSLAKGVKPGINRNDVYSLKCMFPPLSEQQRIVEKLDHAFAKIEKLRKTAEENLKAARDLFDASLRFELICEGSQEKKLGEVLKLEYGKPLSADKRGINGKYPVYGANGEIARSNEYYFDKQSIIVGRKGTAGAINITENKFYPLDVTYYVVYDDKEYSLKYLFYILSHLNLPSLAKGVKPGINRNDVYSLKCMFPSLPEQQRIVEKLDAISDRCRQMEDNYKQTISLCDDLKQSLLRKAFNGEL